MSLKSCGLLMRFTRRDLLCTNFPGHLFPRLSAFSSTVSRSALVIRWTHTQQRDASNLLDCSARSTGSPLPPSSNGHSTVLQESWLTQCSLYCDGQTPSKLWTPNRRGFVSLRPLVVFRSLLAVGMEKDGWIKQTTSEPSTFRWGMQSQRKRERER